MIRYINLDETTILNHKLDLKVGDKYIVNMAKVTFIDSFSLSYIIMNKETVVLLSITDNVAKILRILNCDRHLKIAKDIFEALALLKES